MKGFPTRFAICFLTVCLVIAPVSAAKLLIPGGQVIGIHLRDGTVTVAAIDEALGQPCKKAGLAPGDRIAAIDGKPIHTPEDLRTALSKSDGTVEVSILRSGHAKKLHICPTATKNGPRLGIYLKEGTTGIGTVTYLDPETGDFAALGHGVNDPNGNCLSMRSGEIFPSSVLSVKKGAVGTPGQLMGTLTNTTPRGQLSKNAQSGIFGATVGADAHIGPDPGLRSSAEPLPVASKNEIRPGPATIRSTVSGTDTREYSVEIVKIYATDSRTGRNMLIRITDPALLRTTGGIVQGMSGSPIIQNGKLVGAVTHVLVNDPTTGYGIFIENMLDAAS